MRAESTKPAGAASASRGPSMVLGDFELRHEIGRGGMGTVYEAWQRSLQRVVALKVLAGHVSATPKSVVRFQREAQAAAKLHHTHIVPIFAQGEHEGTYYYAMELVSGQSLNVIIASHRTAHLGDGEAATAAASADTVVLLRTSDSTVREVEPAAQGAVGSGAVRDASKVHCAAAGVPTTTHTSNEFFNAVANHMAAVADALEYAHQQGVIHRDIKPHNLILGHDGRMRVSDFGLARLMEQPGVTMTGELIGSPLYMSPEQISGDPEQVDHRSDIYSLGATMYEWLTLTPPYPGETRERVISRILSSEAARLRVHNADIPVDLETVCLKAIERAPDRRYQTAGELRDDLRRFLASRPIIARRAGWTTRTGRFVSRHQLASLGAVAVVTAVVLGWALYVKQKTVETQTAAAVEAKAANELVLDLLSQLPLEIGAPLRMAEAAIPVVQGIVGRDVPALGGRRADLGDPRESAPVGTPAAIARRVGGEFYKAIAPVAWPRLTAGLENDPALRLKEAVDRWNARDADGARQIVEAYLNVRPADYEAWQLYAVLCAESGRSDELLQTTSQLLQLRPREPFGYVWHGLALLLSDQAEGGLVQGSLASTIDGHLLWAKLVRGLSLIPMGRADEAVGEFDEVLRASPELVVALLGRASARSAAGRFAEALPDANEVLRIEPDNADALTIRGDCFTALADYGAAARDFQRAMALAGRTPALGIRYLSALVHERNLAEAKAREEASRPSGVDPSVDPDEEGSRGPLLDWFSRKIWPRAGPAGPADGGS